ncbi:MAG: PAS domain S-box protein [Anaerolineae bacterium]|nr:PAS domain S-box protein [Anaerolineae bacterium]
MGQLQKANLSRIQRFFHNPKVVPALLLGFSSLVMVTLIAGGILFYNRQLQTIRERKIGELQIAAKLMAHEIAHWRQERLSDARLNSTAIFFNQAIDQWLSRPDDLHLKASITERLQTIVDHKEYQNAFLANAEGDVLISADPNFASPESEVQKLIAQVAKSQEIKMSDLIWDQAAGKTVLYVAAPIVVEQNSPKTVLVIQIDPQHRLYPLIQSWPLSSPSSESALFRKEESEVVYLSPLKFHDAPPLSLRIPFSETNIVSIMAFSGQNEYLEGHDYRGVKALAYIQPVSETTWFLESKIDAAEIQAEAHALGRTVVAFEVLAILMTAALAGYAFRVHQRGLYQDLSLARQETLKTLEEARTTLYAIEDGVIVTDANGFITRVNPAAETLTGWDEAEALGKPLTQVLNIISEETGAKVDASFEKSLREGRIVEFTNHTLLISRQGIEHPIAISGAPLPGPDGQIAGMALVFRDQTQERAAQKEQALLTYVITHSLNEVYVFDAETLHFKFVNQGALKNLGYTLEEMRAKTPLDIKPEFTPETFREMIQPLTRRELPILTFETVHQRADGSRYPVEVHLQLFEHKNERLFLAIINDISARKQIQHALQESEARYRALFENTRAVMLLVNPENGAIIDANPAACEFYGWTRAEMTRLNINQINTLPPETIQSEMQNARTQRRQYFLFRHRKKNGEVLDVEVFSSPIQIGGRTALFSIIHDITARKQAEAKIAEQVEELHRWYNLTLGREQRILELKREVNALLTQLGLPPRYAASTEDAANEK